MTTLYTTIGGPGPWACDDDNVRCDGIFAGLFIEGVITCDGIGGAETVGGRGNRAKHHHPGMVRTGDAPRLSRGRDPK